MLFALKKIKGRNLHSITLFSDAFVTAPTIYAFQRAEWKTLLFKWARI